MMARRHPSDARIQSQLATNIRSDHSSTNSNSTSHTISNMPSSSLTSRSTKAWNIYRSTTHPRLGPWKWRAALVVGLALIVHISSSLHSRIHWASLESNEVRGNLRSRYSTQQKSQQSQKNAFSVADEQSHPMLQTQEMEENPPTELLESLNQIPLPTDYIELDELNEELATLQPSLILSWAHHQLNVKKEHNPKSGSTSSSWPMVQVTSFGPTGLVILHSLSQIHLLRDVPVITMDTLHLFPESYEYFDTVEKKYFGTQDGGGNTELIITKPIKQGNDENEHGVTSINSREQFDQVYGSDFWKIQPKQYTKVTKTIPLKNIMDENHVEMWITGRRRSQGGDRSTLEVLEFEPFPAPNSGEEITDNPFHPSKGRWKLNPLAYWTYQQVWSYIRQYDVPYNRLYDQGYTSLGDFMTTGLPRARSNTVKENKGSTADDLERSGRFIGLNQTECGLHSHVKKVNEHKQQTLKQGGEWAVPELLCEKCRDLTVDNFESIILNPPLPNNEGKQKREMLLEFYSPYCGGCQYFAPTLNRLANHLSSEMPNIQVARFDITEQGIPKLNNQEVFQIEATPTLYRVRYTPSFHVELYEGDHEFDSIFRWLEDSIYDMLEQADR